MCRLIKYYAELTSTAAWHCGLHSLARSSAGEGAAPGTVTVLQLLPSLVRPSDPDPDGGAKVKSATREGSRRTGPRDSESESTKVLVGL